MSLVRIVVVAFVVGIGLGLLEIKLFSISPAAGIALFAIGNALLVWGATRIYRRKVQPDDTDE